MSAQKASRILVVDDDGAQARALSDLLKLEGFEVRCAGGASEALALLQAWSADAVLTDFTMPGTDGITFLGQARQRGVRAPFVLMTAFGTLDVAVSALRAGMSDFVTKPVDASLLVHRLKAALELENLRSENAVLKTVVENSEEPLGLVGKNPRYVELLAAAQRVAPSHATVLITGESGSGKEVIARSLHVYSSRRSGPWVVVNCAAIPDALLEAELFGSLKGAYTGATSDRVGRFEAANGGTLFLDEVGDLPLHLQPKLLRVLQERTVEPLGGGKPRLVDVRLVAATHKDLLAMVREGRFREDLYYRLNVIPLTMPALRERPEDILALGRHFLVRFSRENNRKMSFSQEAEERMLVHSWPGNVRELQNCVERAVVLAPTETIMPADLFGARTQGGGDRARGLAVSVLDSAVNIEGLEAALITEALARSSGNVSLAARMLGMTRRAMQYRAGKLGLDSGDGA
ncbi:MAG: sigma-54-dependent Fis family transcriptional regulator [Planctomycetes bacterium]|nr:sigma-54-dependent Fis family transcriptional regulator [Planctomycetota bacterium]